MQRHMSWCMCVYVCVQTISILKALIAMPGESDDKWLLSCNLPFGGWMELACLVRGWGDKERGDCRCKRGGRGEKKKESKEFPALDQTMSWELGFPRGEVCICVYVPQCLLTEL